jgi:hypothetical protein
MAADIDHWHSGAGTWNRPDQSWDRAPSRVGLGRRHGPTNGRTPRGRTHQSRGLISSPRRTLARPVELTTVVVSIQVLDRSRTHRLILIRSRWEIEN